MRISVDVKGYYDWVKPPAGTVITQDDLDAGRAKRAANDDEFLIRITIQADTHHDVGIPDEAVERRIAELTALHGEADRDEIVAELFRASCKQHLHRSHMVDISVHDEPELETYLNQVFKTARNARKAG